MVGKPATPWSSALEEILIPALKHMDRFRQWAKAKLP